MKFIQTKRASWVVAMALMATPGLLITSCSKDTQNEVIQPKANQVTFSVKGINGGTTEDGLKRASASTITAQQKIHSFSDVDMGVSVDNTLPNQTVNFANIQRSGGLAAAGTSTPENMAPNVKYVVYIYSGNTLVTSKLMENGVDATIDGLNPATTYTWVALSYNTTDTTPGDQPSLNPTNGVLSLPANKDVLYASGTVKLSDNSNIAILFNHKFARIGIELNTIGIFGEIDESTVPTADVTGLTIAGGNINLLGDGGSVLPGTVTAGTATSHDLHFSDFVKVDPDHNDAKIAYVYTASTARQSAINMKVQNLKIKHVDGNLPRTYYSTAANFTFDVTPQQGQSHHLLLNVIESPLITGSGNTTVKWARSNIFDRNNNDPLRSYAFYAENNQRSRADGYFSYMGLKAIQFPNNAAAKGDPCTKVYPANTWKQPTVAQVGTLTSSSGLLTDVVSALGQLLGAADPAPNSSVGTSGGNHAQYNSTGGTTTNNAFGSSTSNSNNFRIYYNGQITNTAVLTAIGQNGNGLLGLGLSTLSADLLNLKILSTSIPVLGTSYNAAAAFWTDTPVLSGGLLNTLGTRVGYYGYYASTEQQGVGVPPLVVPTGPKFIKATSTLEALNVELLNLDLLQTSFKNVRCVRVN